MCAALGANKFGASDCCLGMSAPAALPNPGVIAVFDAGMAVSEAVKSPLLGCGPYKSLQSDAANVLMALASSLCSVLGPLPRLEMTL